MGTGRRLVGEGAPFQVEGAINTESPSFAAELYDFSRSSWASTGVIKYKPRYLLGPYLCGKTSHARWIAALQNDASAETVGRTSKESWLGPQSYEEGTQWTSSDLAARAKALLKAKQSTTLRSIIETATALGGRRRLLVIDVDYLDDTVIRWVLANVQELIEKPEISMGARLQVLVTGSFTLDTLARHPNSDYPLPAEQIPEFSRQQQAEFVGRRMESVGVVATSEALTFLWKMTNGDKFLTQWMCATALRQLQPSKGARRVGKREVVSARDTFLDCRGVAGGFFRGVAAVVQAITQNGKESAILKFLNRELPWGDLSIGERRSLFKGGVVARDDNGGYGPRAPIVQEALEWRLRRRRLVCSFVDSWAASGCVRDDDSQEWDLVKSSVSNLAAANNILWVYVGGGEVIGPRLIHASVESLDGDKIELEWEVHLYPDAVIGDDILLFAFAFLQDARRECTEVLVWKA